MELNFNHKKAELRGIYEHRDDVVVLVVNETNETIVIDVPQLLQSIDMITGLIKVSTQLKIRIPKSQSERYEIALTLFFEYLTSIDASAITLGDRQRFINYIKSLRRAHSTIADSSNAIRRVFALAAQELYNSDVELSLKMRELFGRETASKNDNWQTVKQYVKGSRDSLEDLYPDLAMQNRELLFELRHLCIDICSTLQSLRSEFQKSTIYEEAQQFVEKYGFEQLNSLCSGLVAELKNKNLWCGLFELQNRIIDELDNNALNFILDAHLEGACILRYKQETGKSALEFINDIDFIKVRNSGKKRLTKLPSQINTEFGPYSLKLLLPYQIFRSLFAPSHDEVLAIYYLLAVQRAQQGTVADTQLIDVEVSNSRVVIDVYKNRAKKGGTIVYTKHKSPEFHVLKNHIEFVKEHKSFDELLLPRIAVNMTKIGARLTPIFNLIARNRLDFSDQKYENIKSLLSEVIKKQNDLLAISAIAQSAQYVSQQSMSFNVSDDMRVGDITEDQDERRRNAHTQFHSLETQQSIYNNRSTDKISTDTLQRFAESVGDEFINAARNIAEAKLSSSKALSVEEFRKIIGLENNLSFDADKALGFYAKEAIALGFLQDETGIWSRGGETYFVEDPFTIFSMIEREKYLREQALEQLERQNTNAALKLLAEMMLVSEQLKRTLESKKREALKKYKHLTGKLPFSNIYGGF